jgi:hypothetical protein
VFLPKADQRHVRFTLLAELREFPWRARPPQCGAPSPEVDRERRINKEIIVLLLRALVMSTRECRQTYKLHLADPNARCAEMDISQR